MTPQNSLVLIDDATVEISLAYATPHNFTQVPVYQPHAAAYLHPEAYEKLLKAREYAAALGYRLRVYDAYRPTEAQWVLWNHTPDPDFLADPTRGSPHSRGVAVDLSLIDIASGQELDFGTSFDAFTPLSHHGNQEVSATAQRNRHCLMGIMTTAGWDFYRNEWWHYQLFNSRDYKLWSDEEAGTGMMVSEKAAN